MAKRLFGISSVIGASNMYLICYFVDFSGHPLVGTLLIHVLVISSLQTWRSADLWRECFSADTCNYDVKYG